ncbi:MAG: hypothetical protein M0Z51_10680, partial [Propionibacterium sp.]|nr:hypothetical protein [Propionibacterium sp.]
MLATTKHPHLKVLRRPPESALVSVIGVMRPEFLSPNQLVNIVQQSVYVAIMAAGLTFLISQQEVDLSVAGNYVLASTVAALLMQHGVSTWLAALFAVLMSVAVGAFNALIVLGVRINSLIATLAMGWVLRGLASAVSEAKQVV